MIITGDAMACHRMGQKGAAHKRVTNVYTGYFTIERKFIAFVQDTLSMHTKNTKEHQYKRNDVIHFERNKCFVSC